MYASSQTAYSVTFAVMFVVYEPPALHVAAVAFAVEAQPLKL